MANAVPPSGSISTARPATRKSTTTRGRWRKSNLRYWPHGQHERRKKPRRPLPGPAAAARRCRRDSHKLRIWNIASARVRAGAALALCRQAMHSILCEALHTRRKLLRDTVASFGAARAFCTTGLWPAGVLHDLNRGFCGSRSPSWSCDVRPPPRRSLDRRASNAQILIKVTQGQGARQGDFQ
jgi:hypothetical protein